MTIGVSKRFWALLLVMAMLVAYIPNVAIHVHAATNLDLQKNGISLSYETKDESFASWRVDGETVIGTAKTDSGTCSTTHYTTTLTITNTTGKDATLEFKFQVTHQDGDSITVNGVEQTADGKFSETVAANGTVKIVLTSNDGNNATEIRLSEVKIFAEEQVTVTFNPGSNGTYTVNGNKISQAYTNTQSATKSYALVATADEGYAFLGWKNVDTDTIISMEANIDLKVENNCTIVPVFEKLGSVFQVGSFKLDDLDMATGYAKMAGVPVILTKDYTLTGNHTIPKDVVLLIPFDEAGTLYKEAPGYYPEGTTGITTRCYRKLTLAENASITVEGSISVGGKHQSSSTSSACYTAGPYGQIDMKAGSSIVLESGASLYAWGYVTGSGKVTANSGAKVYELFQIMDWRGGSALSFGLTTMKNNKVFPISQYYIQNIEAELIINYGAIEYCYMTITASGSANSALVTFAGTQESSGLFLMGQEGSWFSKRYDPQTDRMYYRTGGLVGISSITINASGQEVNSADFVLPITSNIDITITKGTAMVAADVALLPGASLAVNEGAEVIIGKNVYLYDLDEWKTDYFWGGSGLYTPVAYSPSGRGNRVMADAKVDINGKITVNGALYTTTGGANICSSNGTGVFVQAAAAGTKTLTYQVTQVTGSLKPISQVEIAITAAKLQNFDGTYVATSGSAANTTFYYHNNKVWSTTQECVDSDKDHKCDVCAAAMGTHVAASGSHNCTYCGKPADSGCVDNNKDHKCDICKTTVSQCDDKNNDHKCDTCSQKLSDCVDKTNDHICDYEGCKQQLTQCADKNNDHKCDTCGAVMSQCADTDNNHKCDTCGKETSKCVDGNNDHNCDVCSKKLTEHEGGTATCKGKAICDICKQPYGELGACKFSEEWSKNESSHWHQCSVCGAHEEDLPHTPDYTEAMEEHGIQCTECGYVIAEKLEHRHRYTQQNTADNYLASAATCTSPAKYYYSCSCGLAGEDTFESGEKNPSNHSGKVGTDWVYNGDNGHYHVYNCCNEPDLSTLTTCTMEWKSENGKHWQECSVCHHKCNESQHNYSEKKYDDNHHWMECACGAKQNVTAHNFHWVNNGDTHHQKCDDCGKETAGVAHTFGETLSSDQSEHYYECICGKKNNIEKHEDGNKDHKCDKCEYVMSQHSGTRVDAVPGNCQDAGNIEYWHCDHCGKNFSDANFNTEISGSVSTGIDPNNHKGQSGNVYKSDAKHHWYEYSCCNAPVERISHADTNNDHKCDDCGYVMSSCTFDQQVVSEDCCYEAANCKSHAKYYYSCKCGEVEKNPSHIFVSGDKNPGNHTGNPDGEIHWDDKVHFQKYTCCGAHYNEATHTLQDFKDNADRFTDETNHWSGCTECGYKTDIEKHADDDHDHFCDTCNRWLTDHKMTHHEPVPSTCKKNGTIEYWSCDICGQNFIEGDEGGYDQVQDVTAPLDTNNHDNTVSFDENGFCPNGCYQPAPQVNGVYQISNAGQLYWFAKAVNDDENHALNAILMKDIVVNKNVLNADGTLSSNAATFRNWIPIGTSGIRTYTGTFDGNGHTISGLYGNGRSCMSFAGALSGTVKNLGIIDSYFKGDEAAVFATQAGDDYSNGKVENCFTTAKVESESAGNVIAMGGIGETNCYYLASSDDGKGGKTADQFASGEVTYLLNGGNTSNPVWRQTCGEGLPGSGNQVVNYGYVDCGSESKSYSNGTVYDVRPEHGLQHHAKKDANCKETGIKEYWECQTCGGKFTDDQGKNPVSDWATMIIPVDSNNHTENFQWGQNGNQHYKIWSCCNTTTDTAEHKYVNGKCVCGAKLSGTDSDNNFYVDGELAQGVVESEDKIYVYENGKVSTDLNGVYKDETTGELYWVNNGAVEKAAGMKQVETEEGGNIYYFFGEDGKAIKNQKNYHIDKPVGNLPAGNYNFGSDGTIEHDADTSKNGIAIADGTDKYYYFIDGIKVGIGLFEKDGYYYYARTSTAEIICNRSYSVTKTNGLPIESGVYSFDEQGRMILGGIVEGSDGNYCYDEKGNMIKGFAPVGDDYYYFNNNSGKMVTNATLWVKDVKDSEGNVILQGGYYKFGEDGKMITTGFMTVGDYTYYMDDGIAVMGERYINGHFYLFNRGNGRMYRSATMWFNEVRDAQGNVILESGMYDIDAEGRAILKTGFVTEFRQWKDTETGNTISGNYTFYYENGVLQKGFKKIGEHYYLFNISSGSMFTSGKYWVADNEYGIEAGFYDFDESGRMIIN